MSCLRCTFIAMNPLASLINESMDMIVSRTDLAMLGCFCEAFGSFVLMTTCV